MGKAGTIKPIVAFRELGKIRKEKAEARMKFGICRVLKNGSLSKTIFEKTVTKQEAEKNAKKAMRLNPGSVYVVIKI